MTPEKIIELAREYKIPIKKFLTPEGPIRLEQSGATPENLIRFAERIQSAAYDDAVKIADAERLNTNVKLSHPMQSAAAYDIAWKIKALKPKQDTQ